MSELDKSLDELDIEIGRALLKGRLGGKPLPDTEVKATAGRWFASNLQRFRAAVCDNPVIKSHVLHKDAQKRNELFVAISQILHLLDWISPVPVAPLAARIVNYGLEKLCAESSTTTT
jgi:hypothetical protein